MARASFLCARLDCKAHYRKPPVVAVAGAIQRRRFVRPRLDVESSGVATDRKPGRRDGIRAQCGCRRLRATRAVTEHQRGRRAFDRPASASESAERRVASRAPLDRLHADSRARVRPHGYSPLQTQRRGACHCRAHTAACAAKRCTARLGSPSCVAVIRIADRHARMPASLDRTCRSILTITETGNSLC